MPEYGAGLAELVDAAPLALWSAAPQHRTVALGEDVLAERGVTAGPEIVEAHASRIEGCGIKRRWQRGPKFLAGPPVGNRAEKLGVKVGSAAILGSRVSGPERDRPSRRPRGRAPAQSYTGCVARPVTRRRDDLGRKGRGFRGVIPLAEPGPGTAGRTAKDPSACRD